MSDVFGPLIEPWAIEQAALSVLSTPPPGGSAARVVYYLAEKERQLGLPPRTLKVPPGPSSYRGGVDADTFEAEWFPILHVVVTPADNAEQLDPMQYAQRFQIEVTATAGDDDENLARRLANALAVAAAKALLDHGSLGIGATNTYLLHGPSPSLLAPTKRQVIRSKVDLVTFVAPTLRVGAPPSWTDDPYDDPAPLPTVETVNVTVIADPIT